MKKVVLSRFILITVVLGILLAIITIYQTRNKKTVSIGLIGSQVIFLDLNQDYSDLGATARLNEQDISDTIVSTSNLDTSKPGTYVQTYTVTYKKTTKSVSRTIQVSIPEKETINTTLKFK